MGGWGTIRDALLHAVESSGVDVRWETEAVEIVVDNGSVGGVRVAPSPTSSSSDDSSTEAFLPASVVIVNADVASAEPQLLPPESRRSEYAEISEVAAEGSALAAAGRTLRQTASALRETASAVAVALKTVAGTAAPGIAEPAETLQRAADGADASATAESTAESLLRAGGWRYSSSTVSFYFCTDRRYEQLRHHNVFLAGAEAWEQLFDAAAYANWDQRIASSPMHFYVHCPARTDPSVCEQPTDDAIMVLVPVPPLDERLASDEARIATERIVESARAAVIAAFVKAGMADFAASIVEERVRTPLEWRDKYNLRRGAVFGLSHNLGQLSYLRPGRVHSSVAGLHWVGASTRPGNGVPLVLIGAMKTAEEVMLCR